MDFSVQFNGKSFFGTIEIRDKEMFDAINFTSDGILPQKFQSMEFSNLVSPQSSDTRFPAFALKVPPRSGWNQSRWPG
jgi:hypothetical protein